MLDKATYEDLIKRYSELLDSSIKNSEDKSDIIDDCIKTMEDLSDRIWKHDCILFIIWVLLMALYLNAFLKIN